MVGRSARALLVVVAVRRAMVADRSGPERGFVVSIARPQTRVECRTRKSLKAPGGNGGVVPRKGHRIRDAKGSTETPAFRPSRPVGTGAGSEPGRGRKERTRGQSRARRPRWSSGSGDVSRRGAVDHQHHAARASFRSRRTQCRALPTEAGRGPDGGPQTINVAQAFGACAWAIDAARCRMSLRGWPHGIR